MCKFGLGIIFIFPVASLSAASQREERRLLGGLRMRTSAAVVLVALLSATLGGYPVGDGGWVPCVAEAAPVAEVASRQRP